MSGEPNSWDHCATCDHYRSEHQTGVGACTCLIIARGAERTCTCTRFHAVDDGAESWAIYQAERQQRGDAA